MYSLDKDKLSLSFGIDNRRQVMKRSGAQNRGEAKLSSALFFRMGGRLFGLAPGGEIVQTIICFIYSSE